MTKKYIRRRLLSAAALLTCSVPAAFAQLGDVATILEGGTADANVILKEYMNPFAQGFGASLNTGWVQSAKPHGFLPIPGFHVRASLGLSLVPGAGESFTINPANLSNLELAPGSPANSPTIAGSSGASTYTFRTKANNPVQTSFSMPGGTGLPYVLVPTIQAGIGFLKKSQINLRYVPKTEVSKFGSLEMFGVGLQHEVLQYIPIAKRIPLVNMSVVGGYSSFKMSKNLGSGKDLAWTTNAWNINLVAGATTPLISILSVYAGAGFEGATSTMKLNGTYSILNGTQTVTDPIDMEFEGGNGFRLLGGLRFRLGLLTLNAEYTKAEYSTASIGFGLGFR